MKDRLKEVIFDFLEDVHQHTEGNCPLCGAEDFPVNGDRRGYEEVTPEEAEEYNIEHFEDCLVCDLERVLDKMKEVYGE